jgi:electron transfer flavoprotein alpha/beta subunit
MNERIQQLAEQVGAVQNVLAMGRHDGVLFTETELEKFSQLIVQDVLNEVLRAMDDGQDVYYTVADKFFRS